MNERNFNQFPQLVTLEGEDIILVWDESTQSNRKINVNQITPLVQGSFGGSASPSDTPNITNNIWYFATTSGTYTNFGGLVVDVTEGLTILVYDGSTWEKSVVPIDLTNYIQDGQLEESLSVLENKIIFRKNKFNKDDVINGFYVFNSSGALFPDPDSAVSPIIPLNGANIFYLSGRNSISGFRFLNESLTPMKPLVSPNGAEFVTYGSGPVNGVYYAPVGAIYCQFTVKFVGTGTFDLIQFEEGSLQTEFFEFDKLQIRPQLLESDENYSEKIFIVNKIGSDFSISSNIDSNNSITMLWRKDSDRNNLYNPNQTFINGLLIHNGGADDNCPTKLNTMYIGGNHGSTGNLRVISNSHGKTLQDVGSKWLDSEGIQWFLLKIIDNNTLYLHSENLNQSDIWNFKQTIGGTLTHLNSASNTSDLVISSFSIEQLYPCNIINKEGFFVDGVMISENGNYSGNELHLIEHYDIIDIPSMLNLLNSNRPVGGYSSQPDFRFGDPYITIKNTYTFDKGLKYSIHTDFFARKSISLAQRGYFGGTQNGYNRPPFSTSLLRYLPFMQSVSDGVNSFDFRNKINLDTNNITTAIYPELDKWESGIAPYRSVDIHNGTLNVNFNLGYLPMGSNRISNINASHFLWTSKKNYPIAFDSKVAAGGIVPAGSYFQVVCFRGYSLRSEDRTNLYFQKIAGIGYLFADWHTSGTDQIEIPIEYQNRAFEVINKTENIEVFGSNLGSSLEVVIGSNSPMYGSLALKIL